MPSDLKARQGAVRGTLVERKHDFYETPPEAVHTLLRHQWLPTGVWDPCAGKGALTRVLKEYGHAVFATDLNAFPDRDSYIEVERDFLLFHPAVPAGVDAIVMNPPFKLFDAFVRQAMKLVPVVCCFGRLMAIEGDGRSDFMDTALYRVIVGRERLPMMHRDEYEGNRLTKSAMPFAWFVFDKRCARPGRSMLDRVSWYA